jgi:DNA excision repair protein ERCC-3
VVDDRPVYVESDLSIFLEVQSSRFREARDRLGRFAELERSPEHIHTYRLTPLSLYNASALGLSAEEVLADLRELSRTPIPRTAEHEIRTRMGRYGLVWLEQGQAGEPGLLLCCKDPMVLVELGRSRRLQRMLQQEPPEPDQEVTRLAVDPARRGHLKQLLLSLGYPAEDLAGYRDGAPQHIQLLGETRGGVPFALREYQTEAAEAFWASGTARGGSGVIVLPCGAGKTVVGMAVMALACRHTLILCTNLVAVRQWRRELLDRTSLTEEEVAEYTGERKELGPVTLTTYQLLTYRRRRTDPFLHMQIFNDQDWGLIIYDEVHLLPAPVFRITAEVQAMRRLGLTATLVREDGHEDDVFSLIGPRRYDVPWKVLEQAGWIALLECVEVRLDLEEALRSDYALATRHGQFRVAAENPAKLPLLREIAQHHAAQGDQVLVIGHYLRQVELAARLLHAPLITGRTPNRDREELYAAFRSGEIPVLVVSKVGNFAIDLPDANIAIQLSGTFGSRQEEAQRIGRILRPKANDGGARFYTLVTRNSREQDFAARRQRFLTEQGYEYLILDQERLDLTRLGELCPSPRRES